MVLDLVVLRGSLKRGTTARETATVASDRIGTERAMLEQVYAAFRRGIVAGVTHCLTAGEQVSIGSGYKIDLELGWRVNLLTDAGVPVTRTQPMMESVVRPDEWGNESKPRNIQQGIFRGGGRPIDLYRRVKYGISGTIMPAADASLSDDDLWDIVYYVYQLAEKPYAKRRVVTAQQSSMAEGSAQ